MAYLRAKGGAGKRIFFLTLCLVDFAWYGLCAGFIRYPTHPKSLLTLPIWGAGMKKYPYLKKERYKPSDCVLQKCYVVLKHA